MASKGLCSLRLSSVIDTVKTQYICTSTDIPILTNMYRLLPNLYQYCGIDIPQC